MTIVTVGSVNTLSLSGASAGAVAGATVGTGVGLAGRLLSPSDASYEDLVTWDNTVKMFCY